MELKVKRLSKNAALPTKTHAEDAGFDLTATYMEEDLTEGFSIEDGLKYVYGTGIAVEIPDGYVGLLFPRSSVYRHGLTLANCVGVIDSTYRGEIRLVFRPVPGGNPYEVGDRVGQLVIIKLADITVKEVDSLSQTDRGASGFGSTGK